MITLNSQQREAVDRIHDFLSKPSPEPLFLLSGSAGTGKTTCIQTVIREQPTLAFCLTAPTNKATKVLQETSEREGLKDIPCKTIYSLLGLRLSNDDEKLRVDPTGNNQAEGFDVIIVDEASMVNEKLFQFIVDSAFASGVKVVFMGDPLQLPPVGETSSPALQVKQAAHLTKVERHDNQILHFATSLRDAILNGTNPVFRSDADDKGGVYCVDWRRMRGQIERGYTSDLYQTSQGKIKTIAWRNDQVRSYNAMIRRALYGDEADRDAFMKEERVVASHPIMDITAPEVPMMVTDEEGNVSSVTYDIPHPMFPEFRVDALQIETEFSKNWANGFVVREASQKDYTEHLNDLAKKARERKLPWSSFWAFKNTYFHDIRPCHAITAHRSQGSTYEACFVDVEDILCNMNRQEALRCLYVAATRARRILVMKTR